ncbi:hypothetical protein [Niastella sp. OAS944]|uniref:hypothetical protein n=1 Tax=Niastella sp. OAS944 TaxID=2664089 RepID=UPI00346D0CDB|nr:hypothetical protein [Chitinophagaceae bacterium OAS944]
MFTKLSVYLYVTFFSLKWRRVCDLKVMQPDFSPLELQVLIDLLAEETQKYTRAFISGNQQVTAIHRATIDALVAEINSRKKSPQLPVSGS